jgi:hypothetical protein
MRGERVAASVSELRCRMGELGDEDGLDPALEDRSDVARRLLGAKREEVQRVDAGQRRKLAGNVPGAAAAPTSYAELRRLG